MITNEIKCKICGEYLKIKLANGCCNFYVAFHEHGKIRDFYVYGVSFIPKRNKYQEYIELEDKKIIISNKLIHGYQYSTVICYSNGSYQEIIIEEYLDLSCYKQILALI